MRGFREVSTSQPLMLRISPGLAPLQGAGRGRPARAQEEEEAMVLVRTAVSAAAHRSSCRKQCVWGLRPQVLESRQTVCTGILALPLVAV